MPGNQYDQTQRPPAQTQTVQEDIHSAVTVTTDRTIQATSTAELQNLEQTVRKTEYGFAF